MKLELKIVDLLLRNKEKDFTIHEISKTLKQHYSLVHRFIEKLAKDNILVKKKIGKAYICSLNLENEKTHIILTLSEIERKEEFYSKNKEIRLILEDLVNSLKEVFRAKLDSVVLFGSYANGTASKDSDIDILILAKNKSSINKKIKELYAKYGREISVIMLTPRELEQQKQKEFVKEIIKNHYVLYGSEKFIRRFK